VYIHQEEENTIVNKGVFGGFLTRPLWGGFAQYTHLPEVNVAKLPDNASFDDAAAAAAISMVGTTTAWSLLLLVK
jgi:alcohol dehydrogenase